MAEGKWISGLSEDMPAEEAARLALHLRVKAVIDLLPRALAGPQDDPEPVHQLRVSTRRAAAALRSFADLLPGKYHKGLARQLRRIRRAAGEARDWDVFRADLAQRLAEASPTEQPGLDLLIGLAH